MKTKFLTHFCAAVCAALLSVSASAQSILGSAGNYTVLAGTTITNNGNTVITGNIALSPGTSVTGFGPGIVTGNIDVNNAAAAQAQTDLLKAYNGLAGMASTANKSNVDMGGTTLLPGVYKYNGAATLTGALQLDANFQNHVTWVFQIGTDLTTSGLSSVTIINPGSNGGSDDGIFWQMGAAATIGGASQMKGNFLAGTSITYGATQTGTARSLAFAAVTLNNNAVHATGGQGDYTGGVTFNGNAVVLVAAPTFTTQPTSASINVAANAQFTAIATGTPSAMTYAWQMLPVGGLVWSNLSNNATYSGVLTSVLSITAAPSSLSGVQYRNNATNGVDPDAISNTVTLTVSAPPAFTTQPVNHTANVGDTFSFTVVASGSPAASYLWQALPVGSLVWANLSNNATYSGTATATLTITAAPASLNGVEYRSIASNGVLPDATSNAATLTIVGPPTFTTQPVNHTANVGDTFSYTVVAAGSPAPNYIWQMLPSGSVIWATLSNNATFSGTATATLTVTNTQATLDGSQFRSIASNGHLPNATSTAATLTVSGAPAFTTQPVSHSVNTGATTQFTVAAGGSPASSFTWEVLPSGSLVWAPLSNDATYSGTATSTLTITAAPSTLNGNQYRSTASNGTLPNATSTGATLTVVGPPAFTTQPIDQSANVGDTRQFTVVAAGSPVSTYTWQVLPNGSAIWTDLSNDSTFSGTATATLTVTDILRSMDGAQFRSIATNGNLPDATSNAATLTVASTDLLVVDDPMQRVWDLSGTYNLHLQNMDIVETITMDANGRYIGTAAVTAHTDAGDIVTNCDFTALTVQAGAVTWMYSHINGASAFAVDAAQVPNSTGVGLVNGRMVVALNSKLKIVQGTLTLDGDVSGTVTVSAPKQATLPHAYRQVYSGHAFVSVPMPVGIDGTWAINLTLNWTNNRVAGVGQIVLSSGKTIPLAYTGNYVPSIGDPTIGVLSLNIRGVHTVQPITIQAQWNWDRDASTVISVKSMHVLFLGHHIS